VARITVATVLDAPPDDVWADLEDIASHVEWMADATAIRFLSSQSSGTGTRFECDTKIGPITLTDVMEITDWLPGQVMGVRHAGIVIGTGRFTLEHQGGAHTRFEWTEELEFPWWLGGPAGAWLGRPVLGWVWRRNLDRLAARFAT